MANEFRALSVLLTIALFSIATAVAQPNTNKGGIVGANAGSGDRSVRTPPPSRGLPIYYKAPGKEPASSTSPGPVDLGTGSMDAVDLNNSAVQLTSENHFVEARTLLQRAIEAQPNIANFHRNLSIVFESLKMTDEALASARTAEKLSPKDPSIVDHLCALELDKGNSTAALGCYERLNSIQPLDGLAHTYYAIALLGSGRLDESIEVLEKLVKTTPPIPLAVNSLGMAYYNKKRLTDAAAAFKNAVELAPEMFEYRYNLAITHLSLRNKAGAISQYNILKVGNPELADRLFRILFRDKIVVVPKN